MSLTAVLTACRRRWRLVVLTFVLTLAAAAAVVAVSPVTYSADAQLFVGADTSGSDSSQLNQGNSFVQSRVQSYTSVATSPQVLDPVIARLGLHTTRQELAQRVGADAPVDRVLITVTVTDPSPTLAARTADAVAAQLAVVVGQLERADAGGVSPVRLTLTHPADVPTAPVSPRVTLLLGVGALAGLLLGLGAAVLRELTDTRLRSREELRAVTGVPVLGGVPWDRRTAAHVVAARDDPHGPRAEAYRQVRTNLQFTGVDGRQKIVAVTSAVPGEGKTSSAVNIAAAFAQAGQRTCLIETDLRRPTVAAVLGLVPDVGLTTVLLGRADLDDALQPAGRDLLVLTAGPLPPNPSELLQTDAFRKVLEDVAARVDTVVLDTAPLVPVTDGAISAAAADATVLVVRAGSTRRAQVERAVAQLASVGVRPVGALLSMDQHRRAAYGYGYGGYRSADAGAPGARGRWRTLTARRWGRGAATAGGSTAPVPAAGPARPVHAAPEARPLPDAAVVPGVTVSSGGPSRPAGVADPLGALAGAGADRSGAGPAPLRP